MRSTEGSFWEHLEELRRRLLVVLAVVVAATCAGFAWSRQLMHLVLYTGPAVLQTLAPSEAIVAHLKLSLLAGLIASSPVVFFQFWRFVSPGLYPGEKRTVLAMAVFSTILFAAGVAFSWMVMLDPALRLFHSFETGNIEGHWSLASFTGFLGRFVLVFGLAFQMPLMVLGLTRLGVVTPAGLRRVRSHVIVGLLVVAAILTPPDPVTQVLLALPLYLLFELSLLLASLSSAGRRRGRRGEGMSG
jgi:sec-independent protein translocase protein TatC